MAHRVCILGAAESGVGAAVLAQKTGYSVFVSDIHTIQPEYKTMLQEHNIEFEEKQHSLGKILQSDLIIKSPGISENVPVIQEIRKHGISVISEVEFAYRHCDARIIAITGSNGKTTTTLLTHHILREAGIDVGLAGNVGYSFAYAVATQHHQWYVLEVSSFQLDDIDTFAPDIAILLNITPDHLDRYNFNFDAYVQSKFRIIKNCGKQQYFIYNADDPVISEVIHQREVLCRMLPFSFRKKIQADGGWVDEDKMYVQVNNNSFDMLIDELILKGRHNVYNSMAASLAAKVMNVRNESLRQSLRTFINAPHRLEYVATVRGVDYINDSKATNVNSTWYALESMRKPVVWIAGGLDKGNDYTDLMPLVEEKVKALICLGVNNEKLKQQFASIVRVILETQSMEEAVRMAYKLSIPGDVVLLSPACASFDLFENFEDRGNQFKKAVLNL